jgi:hypothetical protein
VLARRFSDLETPSTSLSVWLSALRLLARLPGAVSEEPLFCDTNAIFGPTSGAQIRQLYPLEAYDSPLWAAVTVYSDAIYGCPMRRLALAAHDPVWRYRLVNLGPLPLGAAPSVPCSVSRGDS